MKNYPDNILSSFGTVPLKDMTVGQITHELHFVNPEIGKSISVPAHLNANSVDVYVDNKQDGKEIMELVKQWNVKKEKARQLKLTTRKKALEKQLLKLLKEDYEPDLKERSTDVKRAYPNYGTVMEVNDAHIILDVGTPGKSYIPWRMYEDGGMPPNKGDVLEHLYIGGLVTRTYWRPVKNLTYKEDNDNKFDGSGVNPLKADEVGQTEGLKEYPDVFTKIPNQSDADTGIGGIAGQISMQDRPTHIKDDDYKVLNGFEKYLQDKDGSGAADFGIWWMEEQIHEYLTSPEWLYMRGFAKKEK